MKTQDMLPNNLNNQVNNTQFFPMADNRILIDSKEVLARNSIIFLGSRYILVMSFNDGKSDLNVQVVVLADVYYNGDKLYLIMYSQNNKEMIFLKLSLADNESNINQDWWLIESQFIPEIIEKLEVVDYCMS